MGVCENKGTRYLDPQIVGFPLGTPHVGNPHIGSLELHFSGLEGQETELTENSL